MQPGQEFKNEMALNRGINNKDTSTGLTKNGLLTHQVLLI